MSLLAALVLGVAPVLEAPAPAVVSEAEVTWEVPAYFVAGEPFRASVRVEAPKGDVVLPTWQLGAAAFGIDGKAFGERDDAVALTLVKGDSIEVTVDLTTHVTQTSAFWLEYAPDSAGATEVQVLQRAPEELRFMEIEDAEELAKWAVLLRTVHGPLLLEMWPEVAPNHVRNFLDLAQTGFYHRTLFNRVWRGFMIQGGVSNAEGTGDGPRTLEPEFSDIRHVRGVLSMARGPELDSASFQFFIMQADALPNSGIDGQYSVFGQLIDGFDALDSIAAAPGRPITGNGDVRPYEAQWIQRAIVVRAPEKK